MNVNKNMHVGLGRQLEKAKTILAEEDVTTDYSAPCAHELPKENSSLAALGIRKYLSCRGLIIRQNINPKDLFFFCMHTAIFKIIWHIL